MTTFSLQPVPEVIEIEIVSGCDCTTLDWTRKPIKPGEKGKVNVILTQRKEMTEKSVDVDIHQNKDPKTNSQNPENPELYLWIV